MSDEWTPLAVDFFTDPKVRKAGRDAALLYLSGLCYCQHHLTDGVVPTAAVELLALSAWVDPDEAATLESCGLWEAHDDGYKVIGWESWNRPAAQVREAKAKERDRKRKWRETRQGRDASRDAGQDASVQLSPSPSPSPTDTSSSPPVRQEGYPQADDDVVLEVAKARGERLGRTSPAWVNAVAKDLARHQATIIDYKNRGKGPAAIDLMLDGEGPKPTVDDAPVAAQAARMERERRRATGEACQDCGDAGLRFDDDLNAAVACGCEAGQEVTV